MFMETIRWVDSYLELIDQTKLPGEVVYLKCTKVEDVIDAIKWLKVRGAPAIGVAAGYGVVLGIKDFNEKDLYEEFKMELDRIVVMLARTRPTAINLFRTLKRMEGILEGHKNKEIGEMKKYLLEEAKAIHEEDRLMCEKIGKHGSILIKDGDTILTHCNAGWLATSGNGTALSIIYTAVQQGKHVKCFVDETRPLLQGARLTAWELKNAGIDVTLICDSMAATVMKAGKINLIIVGADRIAQNGDTANKIGTYGLAVLAYVHKIPFYVAAPTSTIDFLCETGKEIPVEERNPKEITSGFDRQIAPENINVYNPAFDITPNIYISAIITEHGIAYPSYTKNLRRFIVESRDTNRQKIFTTETQSTQRIM